ncbi:MAG: VWA domain-containing protein [Ardenticatenales bacterium]|nr:VWA domain-containing protein [Ardenticatenales bacterium]
MRLPRFASVRRTAAVPRPVAVLAAALAAAAVLSTAASTVTPASRARAQAAPADMLDYRMIGQWPETAATPDLVMQPQGLAAADDGTVYLADAGSNRISMMAPDGTWTKTFGGDGTGPARLGDPRRIEVDEAAGHVYVADNDSYRIVVYDRAGGYLTSWPDIYAAGLSLGPDGRLWVADVLSSKIRAFDSAGREQFSFGSRGSGEGKFRQLVDVSIAPSGDIFVGDRNGSRIQVFHLDAPLPDVDAGAAQAPGAGGDVPVRLLRTLDLTDAKYRQTTGGGGGRPPAGPGGFGARQRACSGRDIDVIDDDTLLAFPCLIDDGAVTFLRGPQASANVTGFFGPYVDARAGLFYSMSTFTLDRTDPNAERRPAVVRYVDSTFAAVQSVSVMQPIDEDTFRGPGRVDAVSDDMLFITDFRGVRRYSGTGEPDIVLPFETFPTEAVSVTLSMATGDGTPDGVVGYGTCHTGNRADPTDTPCLGQFTMASGTYNGEPIDYLVPVWTTTAPARAEVTELHYDPVNDLLLVLNNEAQELLAFQRLGRGRKATWALGGTDRNALYADVGSGADGTIYVLDALRDQIQVRGKDGKIVRTLTGPSDSWRIAGGPGGTLFVLTSRGEVVRLDADGTERARFNARPNENAQARNLADLTVAPDGRVYVADRLASVVSVFASDGGPAREVLAGKTCIASGTKTASPATVGVGQPVTVTLDITGTCGAVEEPSNILLVVNTKSSNFIRTTQAVVGLADFRRHNIGLMAYYVNTEFSVRWTHDVSKVITALETLNAGGGSESSERNALVEAADELSRAPAGVRPVVVLIGAQYCIKAERTTCEEQQDAEPAAEALRAMGARVVVVGGTGDASLLASSDLDVLNLFGGFGGGGDRGGANPGGGIGGAVPVYQRVSLLDHPAALLATAAVRDEIPAAFDYVPASAVPPATYDAATRTLAWDLTDVAYTGGPLTYRLIPTATSRQATNVRAWADFVDGWSNPGSLTFPVPEVDVIAPPTATSAPTATPTPTPDATATPVPTATPTDAPLRPAYLPIGYVGRCTTARAALDVVLAIDISSSMNAPTTAGGPTKLAAAKAAALAFVDQLRGSDRVAVVAFDAHATLSLPLTADRSTASAAVAALTTGVGTALDAGIAAAAVAVGPERPDAVRAIIVVTDGRPSTGIAPALAAAAEARAAGIVLHAVGLGDDVDAALLTAIAGDAERYHAAPGTEDLVEVYAGLGREMTICP